MNAANNTDGTTMPEPSDLPELPELSAERIDEIEAALFDRIADDRMTRREHSSRRRRTAWLSGAAAAAVLVVAVAIAPTISGVVGGANESAGSPDAPAFAPDGATDTSGGDLSGEGGAVSEEDSGSLDGGKGADEAAGREIIATASATVRVDDIPAAAEQIGAAAVAAGGYVESMSVGGTTTDMSGREDGVVSDDYYIDPYYPTNGGWITVRVPADELPDAIAQLSQVGTVEASEISRQDVTMQAVDLRARVDAMQASVDRLTELLAEAEDVSDLIAAESALAERQATLEAYQSELEYLESQVAMSSLSVSLLPYTETVEADPAGFTDGLQAGWNGLVATLNGIVIALGFLIPWILVIAVVGLIVWGVIRLVRRRRAGAKTDAAAQGESVGAGAAEDGDEG